MPKSGNKPIPLAYEVDPVTGCHICTSHRSDGGYVHIYRNGKSIMAHRWVYEQEHGNLSQDVFVGHRCGVKNCINLEHLFSGTSALDTLTWKVDPKKGCWIVTSHKTNGKNYARIYANGKRQLIHRYVYEREHGPLLEGECICHSCDVRNCINPAHLWKGSQDDNQQDKIRKGRTVSVKGESHPRAKLTDEQVLFIREHPEIKQQELADSMGVDRSSVSRVRTGDLWKCLL